MDMPVEVELKIYDGSDNQCETVFVMPIRSPRVVEKVPTTLDEYLVERNGQHDAPAELVPKE